jgi:hypothetical protein
MNAIAQFCDLVLVQFAFVTARSPLLLEVQAVLGEEMFARETRRLLRLALLDALFINRSRTMVELGDGGIEILVSEIIATVSSSLALIAAGRRAA